MPMLSTIFRFRQSRKRDEYITGSSLMSSLTIINRLYGSSSGDRSLPIAMKFDESWMNPECEVMKWYEQQTQSSTKFASIQHRRELKAPFHHEFLLICLNDGAICRLERMGQGSRADAIRRVGCVAHDIIQWFAKGTYEDCPMSQEPSELVTQAGFPRTFDLLDVLAVCYSIQKTRRSSAYTLQRYNCYFLCLSVLTILARRIAMWETIITDTTWIPAVEGAMNKLQTMECKDEYEFLSLGICDLVNPNNLEPRKVIGDSLDEELRDNGLHSLNQKVEKTLWYTDLEMAFNSGLTDNIHHAVDWVLPGGDTEHFATRIGKLLGREDGFESINDKNSLKIKQETWVSVLHELSRCARASAKSIATSYAMQEVEDPTPLGRRLLAHLDAVGLCILCGLSSRIIPGIAEGPQRILAQVDLITRVRLAARMLPVALAVTRIETIMQSEGLEYTEIQEFVLQIVKHASIRVTHNVIQSLWHRAQGTSLDVLGQVIDLQSQWVDCLAVCIGRHIGEILSPLCLSAGLIKVCTPTNPNGSQLTVAEFQKYILKRIHDHAQRVASVGLAAAPLVQSEIISTMAKIWEEMPSGFGSR